MNPFVALTFVSLFVLLIAERRGVRALSASSKVVASTGFLLLGASEGLFDTTPGRVLFAGLVFSFLGDVFLLSKEKRPFLLGLGSFLLAHVAYAVAFVQSGHVIDQSLLAAIPMTVVVLFVLRWLWPHVSTSMRGPVIAYALAIGLMVASAAGVLGPGSARVTNGAILFLLSDLFVARERFVAKGFINRGVGLPLYYAGQIFLIFGMATSAS